MLGSAGWSCERRPARQIVVNAVNVRSYTTTLLSMFNNYVFHCDERTILVSSCIKQLPEQVDCSALVWD